MRSGSTTCARILAVSYGAVYYWITHGRLPARQDRSGRWCVPWNQAIEADCRQRIARSGHLNPAGPGARTIPDAVQHGAITVQDAAMPARRPRLRRLLLDPHQTLAYPPHHHRPRRHPLERRHRSRLPQIGSPAPGHAPHKPKPSSQEGQYETTVATITDRVAQASLKLVLEPIFEADFLPCSYGFRPNRRAHDAVAEIHHFGTRGYRWVLDADVEALLDGSTASP